MVPPQLTANFAAWSFNHSKMGNKTPGKENRAKAGEEEAEGGNTKWSLKRKQKLLLGIQDVEGRKSGPGWRGRGGAPLTTNPSQPAYLDVVGGGMKNVWLNGNQGEAGWSPCSAATPSRPQPARSCLQRPRSASVPSWNSRCFVSFTNSLDAHLILPLWIFLSINGFLKMLTKWGRF